MGICLLAEVGVVLDEVIGELAHFDSQRERRRLFRFLKLQNYISSILLLVYDDIGRGVSLVTPRDCDKVVDGV